MLIEITKHRKRPIPAVLCAVGLPAEPDENRRYTVEFYPIDLILELRKTKKVLEGHPLIDLQPEPGDKKPTVMIEKMTASDVARIIKHINLGRMVAVGLQVIRPPKLSNDSLLRRTQYRQLMTGQGTIRDRDNGVQLYYVDGKDEVGLNEEDMAWVNAVCEAGALYCEALKNDQ